MWDRLGTRQESELEAETPPALAFYGFFDRFGGTIFLNACSKDSPTSSQPSSFAFSVNPRLLPISPVFLLLAPSERFFLMFKLGNPVPGGRSGGRFALNNPPSFRL